MPEPFSILELRRQSGARARRVRRWRLVPLAAVALLAAVVLLGFFAAPGPVRHWVERRLSAELHREVSIRALRINPCVLSTTIDGLDIRESDGRPLFGCERLYVNFDSWSFFSGKWIFQEISLTAPTARIEINKDGTLNISDLLAPPAGTAAGPATASVPRPIVIDQLTVAQARLNFADHSRAQDFATELGPVSFSLKNFSTAPALGAPYEFTASTESGESLHWRGTLSADPLRSAGEFALGRIALPKYAPYYADLARCDVLAGTLDAAGHYELDLSVDPHVVKLSGGELHLHGLKLAARGAAAPVVDLPALDLTGLDGSLAPLKISAGKLALTGGHVALQRDAAGTFNLTTMLTPAPHDTIASVSAQAAAPAATAVAPDVSIADFEIHGLGVAFDDATTPHPAHNAIESLDLSAQKISLASAAPPSTIKLVLHLAPQGSLSLDGTFTLAPLRTDFSVALANVPLAGMNPYLEPLLNLRIAQGTASAQGRVALAVPADAAPQIVFQGDAEADDFSAGDGTTSGDFVSFASLGFKQLDFTSTPLAIAVGQVSLVESALHFTLQRDGSTNLDAILRRPASGSSGAKVSLPATGSDQTPSAGHVQSGSPKITIDRLVLVDGALMFTDQSLDPNVSVAVNQLAGIITGLSSEDFARATVDLRAKVENSASVVITGQINPLSSDAYTNLAVSFDHVDLEPASPYLGKYAGYTLANGSLSLDLKINLAQRRLDSQNVATLDQFTLGQKTGSPDATSLPVRLAISLLKDASGKIVINLPVGGSLDDPEFHAGRVVLRVVTNLLVKAATAPFSLLASAFGGGDLPLDRVDFESGASTLAQTETQKLDVLARALAARPGLSLGLTGAVDPEAETPVLQKQKLRQLLRAKIWESRHAADSDQPPPDQFQAAPAEYNQALVTLFATTFPSQIAELRTKPVNPPPPPPAPPHFYTRTPAPQIILDKAVPDDLPKNPAVAPPAPDQSPPPPATITPDEMESRLAAQFPLDGNELRQLAADRAQHVKDYLVNHGISADRISIDETAANSVQPASRVMLQLK